MISKNIGADIIENQAKIADYKNKISEMHKKAATLSKDEKEKNEKEINSVAMKKVLFEIDVASSKYLVDTWMIKLAYIGLKEPFAKGTFIKSFYDFAYEKSKDIDTKDCPTKFQELFNKMLEMMKKDPSKVGDYESQMADFGRDFSKEDDSDFAIEK
jgi:hypothetical protein